MNCIEYENFELGKLERREFQLHLRDCVACQQRLKEDEKLLALAAGLNKPVQAPLLWAKIASSLRAEKERRRRYKRLLLPATPVIWRLAAMLALTLGLGLSAYVLFNSETPHGNILTTDALQKVDRVEQEYIAAVAELDRLVRPHLSRMDIELMLLYRDRLATIDAQIQQCKEALESNPANAHIRRYMLAALQDKKATLREILELES